MTKKRIANELIESMEEAVQIKKGLKAGRTTQGALSLPAPKWSKKEIKELRETMFKMSQPVFASLLNVKVSTVRAWEQGQRKPDGAACRLLELLSMDKKLADKLAS